MKDVFKFYNNHLRQCKRCGNVFKTTKYGTVCSSCNKRNIYI